MYEKKRIKLIGEIQAEAKALGITTSKHYVNWCKRIIGPYQKKCPIIWNAFMGRKYILPQWRQDSYYSQELLNYLNLEFLLGWCQGKYGYDLREDEVLNTKYLATCKALAYQRPTYWLEKELAKPLLETKLPGDFELEDIHWRFPAMRIYLPKGLLTIRREEVDCSLMYMDITRVDAGEHITVPPQIVDELKKKGKGEWFPTLIAPTVQVSMAATGTLDFDSPHCGMGYATNTPITATQIRKVYDPNLFHEIASPTASDKLDNELTFKMLRLAFNILMLMGSHPIEYDPNEVIRKGRTEGKHSIAALLKAKFIGQSLLRPRKRKGEPMETGTHEFTPHWVKGHWRRVPYGPKHSLRKLQWIGMYSQGDISKL